MFHQQGFLILTLLHLSLNNFILISYWIKYEMVFIAFTFEVQNLPVSTLFSTHPDQLNSVQESI